MSRQKTHNARPAQNAVRIIGGQWRSRKLPVREEEGLRPSGDRLRETLFNWIAPYLPGAHCIDAFAGTGALGLEALSRGASSTAFIETHSETAKQLQNNLKLLECNTATVINNSFFQWTPQKGAENFDLIFLDPPFNNDLWSAALTHTLTSIPLNPEALIYVESAAQSPYETPKELRLIKEKRFGQVFARLYETNPTVPG